MHRFGVLVENSLWWNSMGIGVGWEGNSA